METGTLQVDSIPTSAGDGGISTIIGLRNPDTQGNTMRTISVQRDSPNSPLPGVLEFDTIPTTLGYGAYPGFCGGATSTLAREDMIRADEEAHYRIVGESIDGYHQFCTRVCEENECLRKENERLQFLCKENSYIRKELQLLKQYLFREQKTAEAPNGLPGVPNQQKDQELIHQLRNRCQELLDENDRLKKQGDGVASGAIVGNERASPEQTQSVTNAEQDVDLFKKVMDQDRQAKKEEKKGEKKEEKSHTEGANQRKVPSPEDCAIFLAPHITPGDQSSLLLQTLGLGRVEIADIAERYPRNPLEQRIEGIKLALESISGDRITALVAALQKCRLNCLVETFCKEFNLEPPASKDASSCVVPHVKLPSSTSLDDVPQNDLETVLQPFLKDPKNIHRLTVELSRDLADFTKTQLKQFTTAFQLWKKEDRDKLQKECTNRGLLEVLNCWASIERQRSAVGGNAAQGVEYLARALLKCGRTNILLKLKNHIHNGVVGPTISRTTYLRDISYSLRLDLIQHLGLKKEDRADWRGLTELIGYGDKVEIWEQQGKPAELLWGVWRTRNDATAGKLYDWAVEKGRLDIAGKLEQDINY